MKTSKKYSEGERWQRRLDIMEKRDAMISAFRKRGRSWLRSKTTVRVIKKGRRGEYIVNEYGKYPHSSARQNARIARQLAAGQLSFK